MANESAVMNSDSIKEMFPDWAKIQPGDWSEYGKILDYGAGHFVEIGLYREPLDSDVYSEGYTLQIIFYADVDDQR